MNYVEYFCHSVFHPDIYARRFDFDLPQMREEVSRVALTALPFIGLYRPAGLALSIAMNSSRACSHLMNAIAAEHEAQWMKVGLEIGKVALAVLSLAATVVSFTSGLFITTSFDVAQGAVNTCHALWHKEFLKAVDEALQTCASSAYLAFMVSGALETMLAFALFQVSCSLFQARSEFAKGHYIEGVGKLAMAVIRMNQANQYMEMIQRRNAFLQMQRTRSLFLKIMAGRQAAHLIRHPLSSLKERIDEKQVVLTDGQGKEVNFGAHFHGNGGGLVKGENLAFRTRIIDGKEMTELDFKVNHAFRKQIDEALDELKHLKPREIKDILSLAGAHSEGISVESGSFFSESSESYFDPGKAHKIRVDGLGTILIGSEMDQPNLYDRIVVRMDSNQTLYGLHEMLSLVDLNQALCLSTKDDIERLKMGHLFRTFCPKDATPFERSEEFFSLSVDQLKAKMIAMSPQMKEIFDTYYDKMKEEHIFDGKIRYRIDGLAEAAYKEGGRALTAAVTGAYTDQDLYARIASMLKIGVLSTQERNTYRLDQHGLGGGGIDYFSGGADSIFTQIITEKNCADQKDFNAFYYQSKVRLLVSLDALETGTYQYHSDNLGNRIYGKHSWWWFSESYEDRENILEFIKNEQACSEFHGGNEIMLKERLDPHFFKGLIVPDQQTKIDLLNHLKASGLVQNETILNQSVDRFIRVGTKMTQEIVS